MWSFDPIYPSQIDEKPPGKRVNWYFSHRFTILEPIWDTLTPNYRFWGMPDSYDSLSEMSDEVLTPFVHARLQNFPWYHSVSKAESIRSFGASPDFHLSVKIDKQICQELAFLPAIGNFGSSIRPYIYFCFGVSLCKWHHSYAREYCYYYY